MPLNTSGASDEMVVNASPVPRRPNFMIAGEQKAGTSYLWSSLRENPKVFLSAVKEPHFFAGKRYNPENVRAYLSEHFTTGAGRPWVGEASTRYFHDPLSAQRIKDTFGDDLRFIICLRQPLEKAVSLYLHNFRRGRLRGDERLGVERGVFRVVPFTRHAEACQRYISLFGRERVHFMLFDTLRRSPLEFVNSALGFLSLPPIRSAIDQRINKGSDLRWDGDVLTLGDAAEIGANQVKPRFRLGELMRFHKDALEDTKRTEAITGIDLSEWKVFPRLALASSS